jgi:hypothetical protein
LETMNSRTSTLDIPYHALLSAPLPMMIRLYIYRRSTPFSGPPYAQFAHIRWTSASARITEYVLAERAARQPFRPIAPKEGKRGQSHIQRRRKRYSRSSTAAIGVPKRTASKSRRNIISAASDISGHRLCAGTGSTTISHFQDSGPKTTDRNLSSQKATPCLTHENDSGLPEDLYSLMHVWELPYNWAPIRPADAKTSLQRPGQAYMPFRLSEYAHTGSVEPASRKTGSGSLSITGSGSIAPGLAQAHPSKKRQE